MAEAMTEKIRSILEDCARKRRTITYSVLGELIGKQEIQGSHSWPELDAIDEEDKANGRPDLSLLVVRKDDGLPGKFDGRYIKKEEWNDELIAQYREDLERVYDYYSPGNG